MTERFFYTKDEYETAIQTDVIEYLKSIGHKFADEGKNYVRSKEHSSLIIRKNDGAWSWNKTNVGEIPLVLYQDFCKQTRRMIAKRHIFQQ